MESLALTGSKYFPTIVTLLYGIFNPCDGYSGPCGTFNCCDASGNHL